MVDILLALFMPGIDSGRWQWLWNIYNLFWALLTTGILYAVFLRTRKDKTIPLIPGSWHSIKHILALGLSVGAEALIIVLSEFLRNPDVNFPFYEPLYSLTSFADKFLYIESVFIAPFPKLPWGNIALRAVGIGCVLFMSKRFFQISSELSEAFYKYLKDIINDKTTSEFVKKLWKLLRKFGLIGATAGTSVVIFATKEYRDEITNIMKWLYSFLADVTLLSQLPESASTFPEMAYAFFVMIFSILMAAAYLMLIIAVCSVANVLWHKRMDMAKQLKAWFREIGYIILIVAVVVLVVLFSVLFATKSANFQEAVQVFVENSPKTIFVFLQHTVLLLVAVGIIALMICTLIAVFAFGINFVKSWSKRITVTNDQEAKWFLKIFGSAFLAAIVLACFVFGYDPIRGWLVERFAQTSDGHGLYWVAFQICAALIVMVLVVGAILLSLYLIVWMGLLFYKEVKRVVADRHNARSAKQNKVPLIAQIGAYFQSLGETIFRIFAGYRTESEKNNAIYVAACFASMASLINTAMGLYEFNIPLILAIAMSFAVQLAMLVFGMKAGQGIAENIVSDVKQVGANVAVAIVRKLAACFCYFLAYLASAYGICIAFKVENPDLSWFALLNFGNNFLPVLMIWGAFAVFGYAGVKQLIELFILLTKWFKQKKTAKGKGDDSIPGSEDGSGLLLENPRRIPARLFLLAYVLLMIVSTGFAFTNLFGGYANQVQLHARVYDQVYSEVEKELELQKTTRNILNTYNSIEADVLNSIQQDIQATLQQHERNKAFLEEQRALYPSGTEANLVGERTSYYTGKTADFPAFCEMLQSVLTRDYDSFGKHMTITVYEYSHFIKDKSGNNRTDEKYATTAICVCLNDLGGEKIVIGRINANLDDDNDSRLQDIDRQDYEVSVRKRTLENATKYTLLDEMLTIYETYSAGIWNAPEVQAGITESSEDGDADHTDGTEEEQGDQGDKADSENGSDNIGSIRTKLNQLEILDETRRNIAELYFMAYPEAERNVSMIDLPRVIDLYLRQEDAVVNGHEGKTEAAAETTTPVEETGNPTQNTEPSVGLGSDPTQNTEVPEEMTGPADNVPEDESEKDNTETIRSYDKQQEYQALSNYVDRTLRVYNILNVAGVVLEEKPADKDQETDLTKDTAEDQNEHLESGKTTDEDQEADLTKDTTEDQNEYLESGKTTDESDTNKSNMDKPYTIRKFCSYAKGVANSNFQIAFDTLFRGGMGLNDTDGRIGALYSAQYVSVFIFVICLLVDFMAFFAGLLIFQDAFVLDIKKGSKLEKLGYVNFDAVMTDYFMPTDIEGTTRWHQIALLYYLLHCRSADTMDLQLIWLMKVDYKDFVVMIHNARAFLREYGISADSADFHVWLNSFVKKTGIDFNAILS